MIPFIDHFVAIKRILIGIPLSIIGFDEKVNRRRAHTEAHTAIALAKVHIVILLAAGRFHPDFHGKRILALEHILEDVAALSSFVIRDRHITCQSGAEGVVLNQIGRIRESGIHSICALIHHIRSLSSECLDFFQCRFQFLIIGYQLLLAVGQAFIEVHDCLNVSELVIGVYKDRVNRFLDCLGLLLVKSILIKALQGSPGLAQLHRIARSGFIRNDCVLICVRLIVRDCILLQSVRATACAAEAARNQVHMEICFFIRAFQFIWMICSVQLISCEMQSTCFQILFTGYKYAIRLVLTGESHPLHAIVVASGLCLQERIEGIGCR